MVATHLDHRIAMAFLTLGLASRDAGDGRRHHDDRHQLPRVRRADGRARRHASACNRDRRDDHRHRRAGGVGQGHAGQAHRRPFRAAVPRHRAALSRGGARRGGARLPSRRRWAGARRGARPRRRRARRSRLRSPEAGEAASIVARIPEVRAALLDYQRAFAAPARRRRARRPRYRHGRLPRRRRQDLRHRPPRGARQAAVSRVPGPLRAPSHSRPFWPISCAGTRATPPGAAPPCAPPPTPTCSIPRTWI